MRTKSKRNQRVPEPQRSRQSRLRPQVSRSRWVPALIQRRIAPRQRATHSECAPTTGRAVVLIRVRRATSGLWFPTLGIMSPESGRRASACNVTRGRGFRWTSRGRRRNLTAGLVFIRHGSQETGIACWRVRPGGVARVRRTARILAGRGFRLPQPSTFCFCNGFRMGFGIEMNWEASKAWR